MSVNYRVDSIKTLEDVREALQKIKETIDASVLEKGEFQFFEIVIDSATTLQYSHNLKFTPKDVIQLSITGVGVVTWNYSCFTNTMLDITTTGACVVRAYIGRHREGSNA